MCKEKRSMFKVSSFSSTESGPIQSCVMHDLCFCSLVNIFYLVLNPETDLHRQYPNIVVATYDTKCKDFFSFNLFNSKV